jgi:hypothetical protein
MKGKSGTSNQGVREKLRWSNYILKFFKDLDYQKPELVNDAIENLVNDLREDKKTDNTISMYLNILKRESTIPPNEEIIRHNICNVELQPNI